MIASRVCAVIALAVALSGCAEYQAERAQAMADNDDAQCQSYGAQPGSQPYIQCRMNLDNQRAQMRTAIVSQMLSRPAAAAPSTVNVNVCNQPGQVNTCSYPH